MVQRPDLRIILMSATLNAELFSQYFHSCPIINIPGENRSFLLSCHIRCFRGLLSVFLLAKCFSIQVQGANLQSGKMRIYTRAMIPRAQKERPVRFRREKTWKWSLFCAVSIPAEFPSPKEKTNMACVTWFLELGSPQLKTLLYPCEKEAVRGCSWMRTRLAKCAF